MQYYYVNLHSENNSLRNEDEYDVHIVQEWEPSKTPLDGALHNPTLHSSQ